MLAYALPKSVILVVSFPKLPSNIAARNRNTLTNFGLENRNQARMCSPKSLGSFIEFWDSIWVLLGIITETTAIFVKFAHRRESVFIEKGPHDSKRAVVFFRAVCM